MTTQGLTVKSYLLEIYFFVRSCCLFLEPLMMMMMMMTTFSRSSGRVKVSVTRVVSPPAGLDRDFCSVRVVFLFFVLFFQPELSLC